MSTSFPAWQPPQLPIVGSSDTFPTRRIFCVGQNYADHAREMGSDPSREAPFFFAKPTDSLVVGGGDVRYPAKTTDLHYEVELVVALGASLTDATPEQARAAIFGYAVGLDLTRRDLQAAAKAKGRPWTLAKGFDEAAPISALRAVADVGHPRAGRIAFTLDGAVKQAGDLGHMIWSVDELLANLSAFAPLHAGDLVFTGTPAGVGPMVPGQAGVAEIAGVGALSVRIVPGAARAC